MSDINFCNGSSRKSSSNWLGAIRAKYVVRHKSSRNSLFLELRFIIVSGEVQVVVHEHKGSIFKTEYAVGRIKDFLFFRHGAVYLVWFKGSLVVKLSIWEPQGVITSIKTLSNWPLETFYCVIKKKLVWILNLFAFVLHSQLLGSIWYRVLRIMACAKKDFKIEI